MKSFIKLFVFAVFTISLAASCSSYYQVMEVTSCDKSMQNSDGSIAYSDENIFITYNFWGKNGNVYFMITNKTDKDVTLHLDKSYFVRNGIAYDYFQNRTYTTTNASSSSSSLGFSFVSYPYTYKGMSSMFGSNALSTSKSTTYMEAPIIIIPKNSSKTICQFDLTDAMYRSCDLLAKGFSKAKADSISFSLETTPYLFENRIVYTVDNKEINVNNKFYVSRILNCIWPKFEGYEMVENCPNDIKEQKLINYQYAPNKYFIQYLPSTIKGKH